MDLKKCPFCGGEAAFKYGPIEVEGGSALFQFVLECRDCGAKAKHSSGNVCVSMGENGVINVWSDQKVKAIEWWNRRIKEESI